MEGELSKMTPKPDFSGYATKNGLKCSDGRTIMPGAFKHNDTMRVPLVWQHLHNEPENILGHAILENREDGVYAHAYFNSSEKAQTAKIAVKHGDITMLSIYANNLTQSGKNVLHGDIKEVSLVLSGANPGAKIDNVNLMHGDGSLDELDDEVIIHTGLELEHSDDEQEQEPSNEQEQEQEKPAVELAAEPVVEPVVEPTPVDASPAEKEELTNQEVLDTLDEDQKAVVYDLLGEALEHAETSALDQGLVQSVFESLNEEQEAVVRELIGGALEHANTQGEDMTTELQHAGEKTVKDVFDSMTEEQKNVVYFMIGEALEEAGSGDSDSELKQSDNSEAIMHALQEGFESMSRNAFQNNGVGVAEERPTLTHSQLETIVEDAKKVGSFKEAFLSHAGTYGIDNIDVLFPDAQSLRNAPDVLGRRQEWVTDVLGGAKHSPFSRIKSTAVDLTADEARAKGYVKGNLKKDEIIKLLKRVTTPTTIYKKQKLDRDDIVDITDLDVVAWLKAEMRLMLDEELARAILIGDGREVDDEDKIDEEKIRPIARDVDMYAHSITVASELSADAIIESVLRTRTYYKGTGTPTFYTTDAILTDLILLKDKVGRRLYETEASLAAALRVSKIVTVEVMESAPDILGIVVNMADYTIGADKGGQISMFDDFDIDYNQQKYLIETRVSGALTKPKSAIVIKKTLGVVVTPQTPSFNGATNTITVPSVAGVVYYNAETGAQISGSVVISETTEVEARPDTGYSFPHNTDADWTYVYSQA
jgi:HK97 family phage prohead protease